jgi:hypothetical protein
MKERFTSEQNTPSKSRRLATTVMGLIALTGCGGTAHETWTVGIECPKDSSPKIAEVSNDYFTHHVLVACVSGDTGDNTIPISIELLDAPQEVSGSSQAKIINSGDAPHIIKIETKRNDDWMSSDSQVSTKIDDGNGRAEINFGYISQIVSAELHEPKAG